MDELRSDFVQEKKDLASKDDVVGVNITVNALVEKMKEVETAAKKIGTCDNGWAIFGRNCYYFSVAKYNWYKARTTCIQKSADLVVINNEDEQKFISGKTGNTPYWIGLTDKEEEGNWTWVDGTDYTSSYKSWMKNEPNNLSVEDCGQVWKEGNWNDKACNENSLSICEKTL
ncbi:hepatic lectin-like isoform 2-T2 [Leptodactylus fuscus]|uniref:hepatic lectin-like isoform X2 n=1 Tax=Leptodactylus fuscus TaxID=238119 RepID=UPI003F4F3EB2